MNDPFYRAFEDKHRGSREAITNRLKVYLPFVATIKEHDERCSAVDLGCGRGEWLELLKSIGVHAHGIDLDDGMLAACRELGLSVETGEAVTFLKRLPNESQAIVSGFHIAEHIPFDQLRELVHEALRVLKPAGLLILETPNPENIVVGTSSFYLDPSHQRPIPHQLLSFLTEYYGFYRTNVMRLQESQELAQCDSPSLWDVIGGSSPDYSVIAQKTASDDILICFDSVFTTEYGLSLNTLAGRFDMRMQQVEVKAQQAEVRAQQAEAKAQQAEAKAQQAEVKTQQAEVKAQQAEVKAQQAEVKAQQAEAALNAIYNSRSWWLTAPLRRVRKLFTGDSTPTTRSRRLLKSWLFFFKSKIGAHPELKVFTVRVLSRFPRLSARLRNLGSPHNATTLPKDIEGLEHLSPRARQIYFNLKVAIEQSQKE